jgi:hypothetical protein
MYMYQSNKTLWITIYKLSNLTVWHLEFNQTEIL